MLHAYTVLSLSLCLVHQHVCVVDQVIRLCSIVRENRKPDATLNPVGSHFNLCKGFDDATAQFHDPASRTVGHKHKELIPAIAYNTVDLPDVLA